METKKHTRQVKKNAKLRYYEFLKDIHSVIEKNESCKIFQYCRKHNISVGQSQNLIQLGIIKKLSVSKYKWLKGNPTMLMAEKMLKNQLQKRIDKEPIEKKPINIQPQKRIVKLKETKDVVKSGAELSLFWGLFKYKKN